MRDEGGGRGGGKKKRRKKIESKIIHTFVLFLVPVVALLSY